MVGYPSDSLASCILLQPNEKRELLRGKCRWLWQQPVDYSKCKSRVHGE